MEGSNKNIEHETPASGCPEVSIANDNLFTLPGSYHGGSHIGSGTNSSGIKTCFFQGSSSLPQKDDRNQTDQNLILDASDGDKSTKIVRRSRNLDHNMDPKKLKKLILNRRSAQKSRDKRAQYISDMEEKVKSLETLIGVLSPKVAFYENEKHLLQMENTNLNLQITASINKERIGEAVTEARRDEIKRLKELLTQQQPNLQAQTTIDVLEHELTEETTNPCLNSGTEQYTTMDVHELNEETMNHCMNSGTEHTPTSVWEHELVKELLNPCLISETEQTATTDVWERELAEAMMNPCLDSGPEQTMYATPNQVEAGENENQLHSQQGNQH